MSSSIPPVQKAKNNLQPSTSIGVGVDMPSFDVNAASLMSSTNKKWKKHKSHLYNKGAFGKCVLRFLDARLHFCLFFFLAERFDFSTNFQPYVGPMHYSRTHKFHFSTTFSLKMGLTILFTHLKIILLPCFSIFSFQLYSNGP